MSRRRFRGGRPGDRGDDLRQLRAPDTGFEVFGGTSASAPIVAAVFALAGNGKTINPGNFVYSHKALLYDVTTGKNGTCPNSSYFCTAKVSYDGPTGARHAEGRRGVPNGSGSQGPGGPPETRLSSDVSADRGVIASQAVWRGRRVAPVLALAVTVGGARAQLVPTGFYASHR